MPKYRVVTGDFEVVVNEENFKKAGDLAVQLHNKSNHPSKLGVLTQIKKLNKSSKPTGQEEFFFTKNLLLSLEKALHRNN